MHVLKNIFYTTLCRLCKFNRHLCQRLWSVKMSPVEQWELLFLQQ